MFNLFGFFSKKPAEGDFILTKEYKVKGRTKGGLVLRVEKIHNNDLLECSKGSFYIKEFRKKWKPNGKIGISLENVEKKLTLRDAEKILSMNVEKVKNKS